MTQRLAGLMCVVWLATACGGADGQAAGQGATNMMDRTIPVEVAAAWTDSVVDAIAATGQVEALQSIELRAEVEGRLTEINVREGAMVAEGEALFKVDDAELRAQVARAEADRDLAEQGLLRARQLLAENATSPAEVERAEAQARSARAQLDLLKLRLERTIVRAPFAGVAGARFVSLGDYVNNSTRLIALQTVNPQRASFQVPERYADRLRPGQTVRFQVAALPGREFEGRVDFVDPQVQLPARTITVKAVAPNPRRELQPGMFIEARLATEVRQNATVIPEEAVLAIQGGTFVWVVDGQTVSRRRVTIGVRTPGYAEVRDGLTPGEQVVIGGLDRMVEGAAVQATPVERRPVRMVEEMP